MDSRSRAAIAGLVEGLETGVEKSKAESCFVSICANELSKCLNGPCKRKHLLKEARTTCMSVAQEEYHAAGEFCELQCESRVRGIRTSSIAIGLTEKIPVSDFGEAAKRSYSLCVEECRRQQALDSNPYKECFEHAILDLTKQCALKTCSEKLEQCREKKCSS